MNTFKVYYKKNGSSKTRFVCCRTLLEAYSITLFAHSLQDSDIDCIFGDRPVLAPGETLFSEEAFAELVSVSVKTVQPIVFTRSGV